MVLNKPNLQDIKKQNQKIKTILLQNASSIHYWCSVIGHRQESLEHHLLKCIQWSSGFFKFSEWLEKSQWYHEMSTLMSSYNVQKQHNLALENVRKNSPHLCSVWNGTEWPIIAQNLRSICFQAFLGAFLPQVQGVPVNPHAQGVQNMYDRGARSQKHLVMCNFQSVPCYRKGTDQKPPIIRHFVLPTPLLPYKFWTLWT